ncbi:hypothetical protein HID58_026589 [Brassica napus]|uniref:Beta-galactosidase n=1 Tax=Brassica napus TaxID=3708 RepID=A0ABQ8CPD6_BRANA|nr:hypothetical protein HID58_026589 [Brassica napus]
MAVTILYPYKSFVSFHISSFKNHSSNVYATIVSHDGRAITIDGHRRVLLSGSIHYPRSTPERIPSVVAQHAWNGVQNY